MDSALPKSAQLVPFTSTLYFVPCVHISVSLQIPIGIHIVNSIATNICAILYGSVIVKLCIYNLKKMAGRSLVSLMFGALAAALGTYIYFTNQVITTPTP